MGSRSGASKSQASGSTRGRKAPPESGTHRVASKQASADTVVTSESAAHNRVTFSRGEVMHLLTGHDDADCADLLKAIIGGIWAARAEAEESGDHALALWLEKHLMQLYLLRDMANEELADSDAMRATLRGMRASPAA